MFISLKLRVSKSSSEDLVIFSQMLSVLLNLFCSESKTWLKELSPSQVTWMVLLYDSCGAHEHGEISGRIEQWSEATCTIDTSVYTNDPIFSCRLGFFYCAFLWFVCLCVLFIRETIWVSGIPVHFPFEICLSRLMYLCIPFCLCFRLKSSNCHLDNIGCYFILIQILHKNDVVFWKSK